MKYQEIQHIYKVPTQSITVVLSLAIGLVSAQLGSYSAGDPGAGAGEDGGLEVNIPGVPGEDYPIYADVPDTGFTCDGLVEGGNNNKVYKVSTINISNTFLKCLEL